MRAQVQLKRAEICGCDAVADLARMHVWTRVEILSSYHQAIYWWKASGKAKLSKSIPCAQ